MRAWKIVGYVFVCIGIILLSYGFFVGLADTINPAAIFAGSSDPSMNDFFSIFLSAIAPWMILASIMFVVGGIGLWLGRNRKGVKPSDIEENVSARLDSLEVTIKEISERLDALERQRKVQ